jgi:hypothetical protein
VQTAARDKNAVVRRLWLQPRGQLLSRLDEQYLRYTMFRMQYQRGILDEDRQECFAGGSRAFARNGASAPQAGAPGPVAAAPRAG